MRISSSALLFIAFAVQNSNADMLSIEAKIDTSPWKRVLEIYPLKGQEVRLRVTRPNQNADIRWYRIIPNINRLYHNAEWPWLPGAYRWLGYEKIRYEKYELEKERGRREINPLSAEVISLHDKVRVEQGDSPGFYRSDFGSFWYQVEVVDNRIVRKSPGIEQRDERGLSPKVFRISIRDGDGFLGYLTSFMNVPAVFGSTIYQNKNYIGSDCADILMSAYHKWKGLDLIHDFNVQKLIGRFRKVAQFELRNGKPDKEIRWTKDIKPGDFIAVKYHGQSFYQHIGVLYTDKNDDGLLNSGDLVIHAGPQPLHFSELEEGIFDGTVTVLQVN